MFLRYRVINRYNKIGYAATIHKLKKIVSSSLDYMLFGQNNVSPLHS